jgi:hypothetical protein
MSTKVQTKQPPEQPPLQPSDSKKPTKRIVKPVRGVFEKPKGSGVWWILYYADGVRHREKVGARGVAVATYQKRKSDDRAGIKLPETFRRKKAVTFNELADDAMVYSKAHKKSHRGDLANLNSLRSEFGKMAAEEITPQEISAYLASRTDLKPASLNRYRSTLSMIFQEGIRNGRVTSILPDWFGCIKRTTDAFVTWNSKKRTRSGRSSGSGVPNTNLTSPLP